MEVKKRLIQTVDFKQHFIAFLDILGFSKSVEAIEDEKGNIFLEKLQQVIDLLEDLKLEEINSNDEGSKEESPIRGLKILSVSDSIILSVPYTSPGAAMTFITKISLLQFSILLKHGYLTRGYVKKGLLHHNNGIVFGKSYIDSYREEGKIKYPQILARRLGYEAQHSLSKIN